MIKNSGVYDCSQERLLQDEVDCNWNTGCSWNQSTE